MGRIQKITIIAVLCFFVLGVVNEGTATTGNFVFPANRDYYPETELQIHLGNLTVLEHYNILIGANQNTNDYQWDNFTATAPEMTRTIIHFTTQNYYDNQSQDIQYLQIKLYDNANVELDSINYDLVRISQQTNPYLIGMLLVVLVSSFVIMNIFFVLVKYFWK